MYDRAEQGLLILQIQHITGTVADAGTSEFGLTESREAATSPHTKLQKPQKRTKTAEALTKDSFL